MLFLSLYEALDRLPTQQELYRRCHEMGDLAVAGLSYRSAVSRHNSCVQGSL